MRFNSIDEAYAEQNLINKGFEGWALDGCGDYKDTIIGRLDEIPVKGLNKFLIYDYLYYLPNDLLVKMDRASMFSSVEVRSPFLDYRLVPLVLSLPDRFKIRRFKTKYLLKKIALGILPKKIIKRKKAGFSIPLSKWFKQSERIQAIISDNIYYKHDFFNYQYAQTLLRDHLSGKNDNSRVLWLIFVFNIWYFNNFVQIVKSGEKNF